MVSFYYAHGIDVRARDSITLSVQDCSPGTVLDEHPTRIAIEFELAGDELRMTLDETLAVVDVA